MSEKNPDLVALHRSLGDLVDDLVMAQEASTDPTTIIVLAGEIRNTLFRVTGVQQRLFAAQTAKITEAVAKVDAARAKVDAAIAAIDRLNAFLKTIDDFLALVDKVVGLAKRV